MDEHRLGDRRRDAGASKLGGKRILLGVSGSIAAYRAADIASKLTQQGADVHVALTAHALEFVGAATFRALTGAAVLAGVFDEPYEGQMAHIAVAQSADLVLVAPATANVIAKMAHGIADDALTTLLLATTASVLVAPAMNTVMFDHPATQANLRTLMQRGVGVIEPGVGRLACGSEGKGRLADTEAILDAVERALLRPSDLNGVRIVVSAGATREPIDPVRFLSNRSSGKMGVALAEAARDRGAQVTLLAGHMSVSPPAGVEVVHFGTTEEYLQVARTRFADCDAFIGAAAPADYAPVHVATEKLKKNDAGATLSLELAATPDVISALARDKGPRIVVGFAAETADLTANAERKLVEKGLDLVVANDVAAPGAGFETDTNAVTLLRPDGSREDLPLMPKRAVADRVLDAVRDLLPAR
ncbi:MAG: bifunctional phosphopantothenoylcysteine decarboxylase/phosphopantothenate--cysteine ligase CoaBC [Armatimonadetes bacterium]|nr:bifunctional phosphopantothenoylcysteine decarboxylase/phosphopantothenate--cysteine ligase CoaBC [Armatimonadota bacterium]